MTGRVTFDENGDRVPVFIVDNIKNGEFVAMQYFDPEANTTSRLNGTFTFLGGTSIPPRDIPVCGFDGQLCPKGKLLNTISISIASAYFPPRDCPLCDSALPTWMAKWGW